MRGNNDCTFISYVRVLSMLSVICVHLCQKSSYPIIVALAQVFITGVTSFILITGYLFGKKANDINYPRSMNQWLLNRAKRILIPYYLIVFIILILNQYILDQQITISKVIMFLLCIQDYCGDYFYQISGMGHLWYISLCVLMYIVLFVLFKFRNCLKKYGNIILLLIYLTQLFITIFVNYKVGRYLFYIAILISAFYIALKPYKIYKFGKKGYLFFTLMVLILWLIRIYLYYLGCDTYIYNNIYTCYTQYIGSIWIMITAYCIYVCGKLKTNKFILFLDRISFEIFLTHFMFIDGPLNIMGLSGYYILDCLLVIICSVLSGWILSVLNNYILNYINKIALKKGSLVT